MKLIIAGDLVPTKSNIQLFEQRELAEKIDKKFMDKWKNADFRIFNLECVLGENMTPIIKAGPCLCAPESTINGIKSLNPNLILLSNNHTLDFGIEGLENTQSLLKKNNIDNIGIIDNIDEPSQPYFFEKDGIKVGIYNLCENEFSVATKKRKGCNPYIGLKNYKEIEKAKAQCNYLIVIYHGGKEFYRYPSPNLQRICRDFIECGADIVITQHSHCIGCFEDYKNSKIIYGQGNFIFDSKDDEYWNTSLAIEIDVQKKNNKITYYPIEKEKGLIKLSNKKEILDGFLKRSAELNEEFIEKEYDKFALENINNYLGSINKKTLTKRIKNKISNYTYYNKIYKQDDCLPILNFLNCEAHRELFVRGLELKIKTGDK